MTGSDGRGETSTGMVLTPGGRVLTNRHAVARATSVRVTVIGTGRTYDARVAATDPRRDVALLDLSGAAGLSTVTLARRGAAVGDPVTVVGAAGGRSRLTAASGAVLALDQTLVTPATADQDAERLTGVLLSSCDVVSGESGGPTYDVRGEVVAMTTASVKGRGGLYGVSIPVAVLRRTIDRLSAG